MLVRVVVVRMAEGNWLGALPTQADKVVPYFGGLFTDEPLPQDGVISLPQR